MEARLWYCMERCKADDQPLTCSPTRRDAIVSPFRPNVRSSDCAFAWSVDCPPGPTLAVPVNAILQVGAELHDVTLDVRQSRRERRVPHLSLRYATECSGPSEVDHSLGVA